MARIIKLIEGTPQVIEDGWDIIRTADTIDTEKRNFMIVPFPYFRDALNLEGAPPIRAVWIAPDDDFEPFAPQLCELELIAIDFPTFRDGRGYSVATLLRTRYGWRGELRAIGDVLRDQLNYMRRCGIDSFAVRADKDVHDAMKSFSHYSVQYQGAVDNPLPLFRRREA
jgi:uncharacterized protein (DUF934 family)